MSLLYVPVAFFLYLAMPPSWQYWFSVSFGRPDGPLVGVPLAGNNLIGNKPMIFPGTFLTPDPYTLLTAHLSFFLMLAILFYGCAVLVSFPLKAVVTLCLPRLPWLRSAFLWCYRRRRGFETEEYLEMGFTQAELDGPASGWVLPCLDFPAWFERLLGVSSSRKD